mgnify:CR=1 FL=1
MNLTKQEITWLMETYAAEQEPKNCGCGQDPCVTYGSEETSNMTISGKPDHEIEMANNQMQKAASQAQSLADRMSNMGEANLPSWVQAKITKATDYIDKVYTYLGNYLGESLDESIEGDITKAKHDVSDDGKIKKASHNIEIDINITKADMEKLHDGKTVELKDKTGNNTFIVKVTAS